MRRNRTIWGLVAALAGFALLLGGVAVASNMGFKFVPNLPVGAGANQFNLSLPWNNNYTDAASLFNDLALYGGISNVTKFEENAVLTDWLGPGSFTVNFPITKGAAYIVGATGGLPVHPVIVGSHDPNFTFTFNAGTFNAAAPYHQTYVDAKDVFNAVAATCPGKVTAVSRFEAGATLTDWLGPGSFTVNFPLTLGEGVIINVNSSCAGFVWAHY